MPNVKIELANQNTAIRQNATGSAQGEYVLPLVDPGIYKITATASGFKTMIRAGIEIQVNQTAREDITLAVGDAATTVQVEAQTPVVQSETAGAV